MQLEICPRLQKAPTQYSEKLLTCNSNDVFAVYVFLSWWVLQC